MKKILIASGYLILMFSGNLFALTLEEAISESLNNNLTIKMENSTLGIAEENLLQSKVDFLPSILLSGSISESETSGIITQAGVTSSEYELSPSSKSVILSQTIFNGFGRAYSLKSSKSELELQRLNKYKTEQDIT